LETPEDETLRQEVIRELNRIVEQYAGEEEPPKAIGGPYSLTPRDMLREVENNTELGKRIIDGFAALRKQFPWKE